MFGRRKDGKKLKGVDPIQKLTPYIMAHRHDSQNLVKYDVRCEGIDAFIKEQNELGNHFKYMHIVTAGIIRAIAQYPRLNRFVMNSRLYARSNGIFISFVVKKNLNAKAAESVVKLNFSGSENLFEIKDKIDEAIKKMSNVDSSNNTDEVASEISGPHWYMKLIVGILKFLDKRGWLPRKIISASPFHTTVFLTNLKSIKGEYIYHHLYDFGNTGIFISMGKENIQPVIENNAVVPGKVMTLGIVTDERFCDGFYYISAFKLYKKLLCNPHLLLERLDKVEIDEEIYKIKKK